jgi:Fe2+ or Zn2+ uptake regulation protein
MSEQERELNRVRAIVGPIILAFRETHTIFHAENLRTYVLERAPQIAPASPDRILRALRQEGVLDYVVLNRRQSLYQFVQRPPEEPSGQLRLFA